MKQKIYPPKFWYWLFKRFIPDYDRENFFAALEEVNSMNHFKNEQILAQIAGIIGAEGGET